MTASTPSRVLYLIACGAGAAPEVGRLVGQARQRRWDVHVIATPAARGFLDIAAVEAQTGHAVRSEHLPTRDGETPRSLPRADAIIVAPATYNTINKWALGISDNYALSILAESIGLAIPTVVLPFVNAALAAHPAFGRSVAALRDAFPWHLALDRADTLLSADQ